MIAWPLVGPVALGGWGLKGTKCCASIGAPSWKLLGTHYQSNVCVGG